MIVTKRQGASLRRYTTGVGLALVFLFVLNIAATPMAEAKTFTTIHDFTGYPDGSTSYAGLVADQAGNLYGTTSTGGDYNNGTVFELKKTSKGYKEEVLYSFTGTTDGAWPYAGLTLVDGAFYGTTLVGGDTTNCVQGCGTVFKLSQNKGGKWVATVLYTFQGGADGAYSQAGVIVGSKGNIYGTTREGGSANLGTVFELKKGAKGYTEAVIYSFQGQPDGQQPVAGLLMDSKGNLYGTTLYGGNTDDPNAGIVFELSRNGGTWQETVLYDFCQSGINNGCTDGTRSQSGLIRDRDGNLYGTTLYGGKGDQGTIFELTKTSTGYKESVLYNFCRSGYPTCTDGASPVGTLIQKDGTLYGTTIYGGDMNCTNTQGWYGCGAIFKVSKSGTGYKEAVLHTFHQTDGTEPYSGLAHDANWNLFGTTSSDVNTGFGTVFEVTSH